MLLTGRKYFLQVSQNRWWHLLTNRNRNSAEAQRNFPVVTLSLLSNCAHFECCALSDVCCLRHLWGFTCILETTPSTWNRNPPKFPAALLSIFQSVLRLSSSTSKSKLISQEQIPGITYKFPCQFRSNLLLVYHPLPSSLLIFRYFFCFEGVSLLSFSHSLAKLIRLYLNGHSGKLCTIKAKGSL